MDTVLIIDGLNFIFKGRLKFAPQDVAATNSTVVYQFFRNLRALVELLHPDKIFFCREGIGTNFRKEISADYKANRPGFVKQGIASNSITHDEDFYRQVNLIYQLLPCLPVTIVSAQDVEGDDIMASLVDNLRTEHCIVVSNDNDLIQILQRGYAKVDLYDPFKKQWVFAPPYLHLIFKCLAGDKSDNIAKLVSKKRAIELATDPHKLGQFLSSEESRANFQINRALIELRIVPDAQLIFEEHQVNFPLLRLHFQEMQFQSLLEREAFEKFRGTFERIRL